MPTAQVQAVTEHIAGSELSQDLTANLYPSPGLYPDTDLYPGGERELVVVDLDEFDHDGGLFAIGTESGSYTIAGETAEDGSGVLNLVDSLASTYSAGEPVYEVNPDGSQRKERWADVIEPDGEETLRVRVPHTLYDRLPLGNRDPEVDLTEIVEFAQNGTDLVITDVIAKEPLVDLSSASYTTAPDGSGQRVEIDSEGIRLIDADDEVLANLPTDENQDPNFAGHIDAAGLDLEETTSSTFEGRHSVAWLDSSDLTTVRSYVQGYVAGANHVLVQRAFAGGGQAVLTFVAGAAGAAVTVAANAVVKNLLLDDGTSDFLLDNAWANWTPTLTGWSANPTNTVYRYKQIGKFVHVAIRQATDGTSNATTKTISLPVTAATITNMAWDAPCAVVDNGVSETTPGQAVVSSAGTTITFIKDYAGGTGGFTAAGNCRIRTCNLTYEAA